MVLRSYVKIKQFDQQTPALVKVGHPLPTYTLTETRNPKPETETRNPKPETRNPPTS